MTRAFTTLAFSPSVRATQARYGSRERMEQAAAREPDRAALTEDMQDRVRRANSVIIGTASRDGWPHVQHRGGPRGFIKVLAPGELAFADYSGNPHTSRSQRGGERRCSCCCSTLPSARG